MYNNNPAYPGQIQSGKAEANYLYPAQQPMQQQMGIINQPAQPIQVEGYVVGQPYQPQQQQQQQWKINNISCRLFFNGQQAYQQPYIYGQGQPNYYQNPQAQQVVYVQVVQPPNEKVLFETRLRDASKWFIGCNTVWGIFILLNLIIRCVILLNLNDSSQVRQSDGSANTAAGIVIIIENSIWLFSISLGIFGMVKFIEKHLMNYQIGLGLVIILEVIASIIIFATFSNKSGGDKILFVVVFILTLLAIISFIHKARQLKQAIITWKMIVSADPQNPNANNQIRNVVNSAHLQTH